jgi:hypothetical protein
MCGRVEAFSPKLFIRIAALQTDRLLINRGIGNRTTCSPLSRARLPQNTEVKNIRGIPKNGASAYRLNIYVTDSAKALASLQARRVTGHWTGILLMARPLAQRGRSYAAGVARRPRGGQGRRLPFLCLQNPSGAVRARGCA